MDEHNHEVHVERPRPNYAVAAIVFVVFIVGLSIALAAGRYPEAPAPAGEGDPHHGTATPHPTTLRSLTTTRPTPRGEATRPAAPTTAR